MQVKISAREGGRQRKVTHCCRRDAVKETLCRIFSGGNAERKGYIKQKIVRRYFMGFQKWPKREPLKNFFPVPNEIFILGLSLGEIAVYCYLLRTEDRQTFQCYPSYEAIGKAVGGEQEHRRQICPQLGGEGAHPYPAHKGAQPGR